MLHTCFQHPDTGRDCGATFDPKRKLLIVTCEDEGELLRKPAASAQEAARLLREFGVEADEAVLEQTW